MKCWPWLVLGLLAVGLDTLDRGGGTAVGPPAGPVKVEADGLHNVLRITARLYSGNGPDGAKAFASLQKLGIKTVISVDGARPNLMLARKFGLTRGTT